MEEEEATGEYLENKIKSHWSVIHLCALMLLPGLAHNIHHQVE